MSLGVSVGMCFCVWKYVCAFGYVLVGIRLLECACNCVCVLGVLRSASSVVPLPLAEYLWECVWGSVCSSLPVCLVLEVFSISMGIYLCMVFGHEVV